mgnify:CR=1 FL=1
MNKEEKRAWLNRVSEEKDGVGFVIVCKRGTRAYAPIAVVDECFLCDSAIVCYRASQEKKKDGFFLLCRGCFASLLPKWNARGAPVTFGGRIHNNKLPDHFNE